MDLGIVGIQRETGRWQHVEPAVMFSSSEAVVRLPCKSGMCPETTEKGARAISQAMDADNWFCDSTSSGPADIRQVTARFKPTVGLSLRLRLPMDAECRITGALCACIKEVVPSARLQVRLERGQREEIVSCDQSLRTARTRYDHWSSWLVHQSLLAGVAHGRESVHSHFLLMYHGDDRGWYAFAYCPRFAVVIVDQVT